MIKTALYKLLSLHKGEGKNAFFFSLLAFIWSLGVMGACKLSDALFLEYVGAKSLPSAYLLIACGAIISSSLLIYAFNSYSSYHIFAAVLAIGSCFYTAVSFCFFYEIAVETLYFWFTVKVVSYLFFVTILSCFWMFIDPYHDIQGAKRVYTLIYSCIFLGVTSTGALIQTSFSTHGYIYSFFALCFFSSFLSTHFIYNRMEKKVAKKQISTEQETKSSSMSWRELISAVLNSKFTFYLILSDLCLQILLRVTDYQVMLEIERHFSDHIGEGGLIQFLGKCVAIVGCGNVLFCLFAYSRLVKKFGVNNLDLCTPIIFLVAFSSWIFSNHLFIALLGYFALEGLSIVLDDNNFNLLIEAVPARAKNKIRVAIEVFFEPLGVLLGGALLSIPFVAEQAKLLGLILAIFTIIFVFKQRSYYFKGLYLNLKEFFNPSIQEIKPLKISRKECVLLVNKKLEEIWQLKRLEKEYEPLLEEVVVLLASSKGLDDSTVIINALKSPHTRIRAHALEIIEKISGIGLYNKIKPLYH